MMTTEEAIEIAFLKLMSMGKAEFETMLREHENGDVAQLLLYGWEGLKKPIPTLR
jgi:hypothetical protein